MLEPYELLEHRWAEANQLDPAGMVACASGTAALHLAFEALELAREGKVLVPDFAMIACARAVTLAGLEPVFVEVGKDLLISPSHVKVAAERCAGVVGMLVVHTYGRRCDMNQLITLAGDHSLAVVEDLAEAHGIPPHPESDAACWSFYRNKIVAGEEGGAVWFANPAHAQLARSLRCLGFTPAHDFTHIPRGHNYRLANSLAEKILDSLRDFQNNLQVRRRNELEHERWCPPEWRLPPRDVVWVYDFQLPNQPQYLQDKVVRAVQETGLLARHGFRPLSGQQEYQGCQRIGNGLSYRLGAEVVYLDCSPGVTPDRIARAWEVIHQVTGKGKR